MAAYYEQYLDRSELERPSPSIRLRLPVAMMVRIDRIAAAGPYMDRSECIRQMIAASPQYLAGVE